MKHSYTQKDLVHAYFYAEHNERCYSPDASFQGKVFNSYWSTVGYIYKSMLLVSRDSMHSSYTSKTLNMLIRACPFSIVPVKFVRDDDWQGKNVTDENMLGIISANFTKVVQEEMNANKTYTRRADRDSAMSLLGDLKYFCEMTGAKVEILKKYKRFLDTRLNTEHIKKVQARIKERAQKKAQETKKCIANFKKRIATVPILESINKYCFEWVSYNKTNAELKERELFEKSFGIDGPSFVMPYVDKGIVRTTQGIEMKISDIIPLLKLWKRKSNLLGKQCGPYPIVENNSSVVKIGCHRIPYQNIKALADTLL